LYLNYYNKIAQIYILENKKKYSTKYNFLKFLKNIKIHFSGGPGSLKGNLTQELAHDYNFITLNVEEIVFSYLPVKLAHTVSNTVEVQDAIKVVIVRSPFFSKNKSVKFLA
jgi:hypothetical protein